MKINKNIRYLKSKYESKYVHQQSGTSVGTQIEGK